ncbi:hypothetical protein V499_09173 [Pseudogymnoascus sp. VKM F-103]|uniref:Glutamate-1-semialdehyde 2,1-aminomutase n=1 Tax=Pseudogymnoascus verrucosus TaxID=342668 RepID=A0A1B8GS09_9PEZI|nr:uncharacterized protein VE01_03669 [Pseudogymnoascus verrucosus]KFY70431.1 hypothetical protein V499_09173 [Pseudogymnoascus sp. VKM F-103]OBT98611.1 hypothetical protein VE01_03669 [Pseudogymnoascus verrucosus]
MASADSDVHAALQDAVASFVAANPASEKVFNRASDHLPAGNTRSTLFSPPFPVAITIASGCSIRSADGDVYLDMVGEYTAGIYGHSHPDILQALEGALLNGVNFGATSPLEGELAARIKKRFQAGAGLEMVRFTNSGTEANILATTTAQVWTGRSKILTFAGSYHGSVLSFHTKGELDPMTMPGEYVVADYNSIESVDEELSRVPADSLAAILVEPMQGAGGCLPASIKFLQHLRARATELKALLIFDEVMTSRLHHAGGLAGKYGIKPDLMTMGKYLGGGMSFGIFGGRREIMELFNPKSGGVVTTADGMQKPMSLMHSGTFNNNVLTMHAGIAGTKILTEAVLTQLNELGDYLRQAVLSILVEKGLVCAATEADMRDIATVPRGRIWISGVGSINAIHFGANDELVELRDLFYFHMIKNHIYVTRRGFVALTIVHTKDDIDRYVKCVASFADRWGGA